MIILDSVGEQEMSLHATRSVSQSVCLSVCQLIVCSVGRSVSQLSITE